MQICSGMPVPARASPAHETARGSRQMTGRGGFPFWLVLISGPPRAGKNRAGVCLAEQLGADHFALSNMLKRLTHSHFGLDEDLPPLAFEDSKDSPMEEFGGMTPREAYIMYSETIMKPQRGPDCLGQVGKSRITKNRAKGRVSVVSGVGFLEEIRPLIDAAGGRRTLHVQISLAGDSPVEDSREHLRLAALGVTEIQAENRGCENFLNVLRQRLPQTQI